MASEHKGADHKKQQCGERKGCADVARHGEADRAEAQAVATARNATGLRSIAHLIDPRVGAVCRPLEAPVPGADETSCVI